MLSELLFSYFAGCFNQSCDAISGLSTLPNPKINALHVNPSYFFLATSNWVMKTHTLNKATVTASAGSAAP